MPRETIVALARDACLDLFASYGVELVPADDDANLLWSNCGIVSFAGDDLRGSVVLAASDDVIGASSPIPGTPSEDWTGELANQLLGRLKTRLLARGVQIAITPPLVLRGLGVVPIRSDPPLLDSLAFRCAIHPTRIVRLWLDLRLAMRFRLGEATPEFGLAEGAAVLFES